jgi:transposase
MIVDNQAAQEVKLTSVQEISEKRICLFLALELSRKKWKLGFSDGKSRNWREVTIEAQDLERLEREVEKAKQKFGLAPTVEVKSCYEAGREGFWLHRWLVQKGIGNVVVDAASIEVNRRSRRAKTDRLDVRKLLDQLIGYWGGDHRKLTVVNVPSIESEDARQLHREMEILKYERTQHRTRIQSLLFTQGVDTLVSGSFLQRLDQFRIWNGDPVPPELKARLVREYQRMQLVEAELGELKKQQREQLRQRATPAMEKVKLLQTLCGIAMNSSWMFVMELFGWRHFSNRRQVGAAMGATPVPYQSGDSHREQGISRSGNRRVRSMAVEIAWCWLRFQPDSHLSRWYQSRFGHGGKRLRRIGIVALARRLMIDLWRYLETGTIPKGAKLKVQIP